jgi:hypothetical protein
MNAVTESASTPPPSTGIAQLDEALANVNLTGPVAEHPEQLAAAVEVLQQTLRTPPQS